ncbi:MAG TPA: 50S ribosomal protein L9 [Pseudolysinimonas sp.]|jgi:large subunit ribosomal protein L9|nr:50S ribosomal protein L9 [Pseudolysinimonas sp.]
MEVILRQYVEHLGKRGDVVKVAAGYARNYLLPRKLALPATDGNKRHVERERKIMEVKESDEKAQAQAIASRLEAVDVVIARRVGDTDQLYGSVTSGDIADFLKSKGFEIDRRKLILPEAIKTIGTHPVPLKLHRDVTVPLKVQVVKEGAQASTAAPAPAPAPAEKTE